MLKVMQRIYILRPISLLLVATLFLSGCAGMNPGNVDRAQGTAVGAGGGALAGAGVGYAATGDWRGAAIGAGIGAIIGGIAGYNWGKHVALKKEQYVSEEQYLNAAITNAEQTRAAAVNENKKLQERIAKDDAQTQQLLAQYQANQATAQDLKDKANDIAKQQADINKKIARVNEEITYQRQYMENGSQGGGSSQQLTKIDAEIQALEEQKGQLEQSNERLSEISNRLSV